MEKFYTEKAIINALEEFIRNKVSETQTLIRRKKKKKKILFIFVDTLNYSTKTREQEVKQGRK